jgi:hypothetical protein
LQPLSTPHNSDSGTVGARADFYAALMAHKIHENQLMWSMTQLLIALQGGGLLAAYSLRHSWLAQFILGVVTILTVLLFFLVLKSEADRDVNEKVMDALAADLIKTSFPPNIAHLLPAVRFTSAPKGMVGVRGRFALRFALWLFVLVDLALAALIWFPSLLPPI